MNKDEALEKKAENARELGLNYEPVACVEYIPCCTDQTCPKCKATTPPQRTWVGLTDEEIAEVAVKTQDGISPRNDTLRFAIAIESALRSKNHD